MLMLTSSQFVEASADKTITGQSRIDSVDMVRGIVMVLMAIDHVRVYSGIPAGGPEAGVFFTRWVTHFCAPAFAFFAGTSAFLYGSKIQNASALARYLLTRGLLLVALELTLIRLLWAFNISADFILAGVIWMLGWCMVLLAGMVRMRPKAIGIMGVAIIVFQQVFQLLHQVAADTGSESLGKFAELLYSTGNQSFGGMNVLYCLIPWIGVMMAGYGFGEILLLSPARRKNLCLYLGLAITLGFVVIGTIGVLMSADESTPYVFQLLNQRKYPASQLYLMMTLGPAILALPFLENVRSRVGEAFKVIGRVPFFYYLAHILVIHLSALVVQYLMTGEVHHEWYDYAPFTSIPQEQRWSLALLYGVFIVDVVILFFLSRWYADYKLKHPNVKWLKYL